jgi:hypothetical protein
MLVLTIGATTHGSSRAAPATFLDAGAWFNAIAGLPGQGLAQLPAVPLDRMTFSDAHGTWTHDNQVVHYTDGHGNPASAPRTQLYLQTHGYFFGIGPFPAAGSSHGAFSVNFGCYTAIFPCIGLQTIEIDLGFEIHGFGGHLDYYKGYPDGVPPWPGAEPIPLLADAYWASPETWPFFSGFFGVIFEAPTRVIRLAWWENGNMDDSSSVRFTNTFVITDVSVPEPGTVGLLTAALVGLLALSQTTRIAAKRRRLR